MMTLIFILSVVVPIILICMNLILFKKNYLSREKLSPFECGFDPKVMPRMSFSLKFYLISIIFLIFDIEIALILPIPIIDTMINPLYMIILFGAFLIILMLGLLHEWKEAALNWLV